MRYIAWFYVALGFLAGTVIDDVLTRTAFLVAICAMQVAVQQLIYQDAAGAALRQIAAIITRVKTGQS
jgi:hypothetical protein